MLVKNLNSGMRVEYRAAHPSHKTRQMGTFTCKIHSTTPLGDNVMLVTDTHPSGICFAADMEIKVLEEPTEERQMMPAFARKVVRTGRSLD
jgi:hypothetical protein